MSKWISIEDEPLPENCLVFLSKESLDNRVHSYIRHSENMDYIGHRFKWDVDADVTHWMPLPEPPKTK